MKKDSDNVYPSIYHIGVMKSGTTALQAVLKRDPRLQVLEYTRFFNTDRWYRGAYPELDERLAIETDENIVRQFNGMSGHLLALERIASVRPDARIVLTLREQSGALLSGYKHHLRQTFDSYSFETFLSSAAGQSFRDMLCYDRIVADILRFFPKERVHLFLYEELKTDPQVFLERFYRELFDLEAPEWEGRAHNEGVPPSRIRLKRRINALKLFRKESWANPIDGFFLHWLFRGIGYFFSKKGDDREFLKECPYFDQIMEEYAGSNARLLEMMDLPLEAYGYGVDGAKIQGYQDYQG